MSNTENKNIQKEFNFHSWVERLKNDFFIMAYSRENALEQLKKFDDAIETLRVLNDSISNSDDREAIGSLLHRLTYSYEREYLQTISRRKKRKGPRPPWTSHMKLVVYALEEAKGDKDLLFEIRRTLQTEKNLKIGHNEESLYCWSQKLSDADRMELPTFRSVNTDSDLSRPTQWANDLKRAYKKHIIETDKRAQLRFRIFDQSKKKP